MMKKYKLIKKYPCSSVINIIIEKGSCGHWYNNLTFIYHNSFKPEDYPEFWQEIIEKEYEILFIISTHTKNIISYENGGGSYTKHTLKSYKDKDEFIKSFMIDNYNSWKIYSIKRLSDGETFIIGDKLKTGIIQSIHILNTHNTITFGVTKNDEDTYITDAIKIKQPLFTTEDAVDIFEGDIAYLTYKLQKPYSSICNNKVDYFKSLHNLIKVFSTEKAAQEYIDKNKPKPLFTTEDGVSIFEGNYYWYVDNFVLQTRLARLGKYINIPNYYFSTQEKAEEYILMNKPCLSINDVLDTSSYSSSVTNQKLKELVKSRL